jgi:hypothetical protein
MDEGKKTFVRITNQHIFNKLCDVENHVKETNGKVKSHSRSINRLWWALGILFGMAVTVFSATR